MNWRNYVGRFSVEFEVANHEDVVQAKKGSLPPDQVRRLTISGVVDTGAARLVPPFSVVAALGFPEASQVTVKFADGRRESKFMIDRPLRILLIGAHPDDADIKAGGTAAKWCALGHVVRLVSLTNGQAGHQTMYGPQLARRRRAEAQAAGSAIGATYEVSDQPDGELDDRLETRHHVIRLIRSFHPDLVITHRSTDYHPDHRFTGLLVQDAAYLLTVPAICPDVPHLPFCPVILSFSDAFTRPCPFEPHIVVDIEDEFDRVVAMLHCHQSQFYEWLPYNAGFLEQVPREDLARAQWLAELLRARIRPLADRYRDLVIRTYGQERGEQVRLIEAFEVSEYGAPLDANTRARLFPFLPAASSVGSPPTRKTWVDIPEGGENLTPAK